MSNENFLNYVSNTPRHALATSLLRHSEQETVPNLSKTFCTSSTGSKHTGCYSSSENCLGEHYLPQHTISSASQASRSTEDRPRKPEKSASPKSPERMLATLSNGSTKNDRSSPKEAKEVLAPSKSLADIEDTWESLGTDHAPRAEGRCHDGPTQTTATASQGQAATGQVPTSSGREQAALSPALHLELPASAGIPGSRELDTQAETEPNSKPRKRSSQQGDNTRLRVLMSENRRLKRRRLCRMCEQNAANIALLPCGHLIYCDVCARTVTHCGSCQRQILADVKTYMC